MRACVCVCLSLSLCVCVCVTVHIATNRHPHPHAQTPALFGSDVELVTEFGRHISAKAGVVRALATVTHPLD